MGRLEISILASGSKGNLYSIQQGDTTLLVEAGVSLKEFLKINPRKVAGCLISHEHGDHAKYVREFLQRGIPCFMTEGTAEAIGYTHFWLETMNYKKPDQVGGFTVTAFEVNHNAREPAGFVIDTDSINFIQRVVYATDTTHIKYQFPNMTHLMVECNYDEETLKKRHEAGEIGRDHYENVKLSHQSLETLIKFLERCDLSALEEIYLLHLSKRNANRVEMIKQVQELTAVPVYTRED